MSMTLCWMKIDLIVYCGCLGNKGWSLPYCSPYTYIFVTRLGDSPSVLYHSLSGMYTIKNLQCIFSESHRVTVNFPKSYRVIGGLAMWSHDQQMWLAKSQWAFPKSPSYSKFLQSHKRLSSTVIWIVVSQLTVAMSVSLLHQECIKTNG